MFEKDHSSDKMLRSVTFVATLKRIEHINGIVISRNWLRLGQILDVFSVDNPPQRQGVDDAAGVFQEAREGGCEKAAETRGDNGPKNSLELEGHGSDEYIEGWD